MFMSVDIAAQPPSDILKPETGVVFHVVEGVAVYKVSRIIFVDCQTSEIAEFHLDADRASARQSLSPTSDNFVSQLIPVIEFFRDYKREQVVNKVMAN